MSKDTTKRAVTREIGDGQGELIIAEEVIQIIAALAATEVEGVDSMAGDTTREWIAKLGIKDLSRGVRADLVDQTVRVEVSVYITYGYSIPKVAEKVQEKVKSSLENMTGLEVLEVNVVIAGVHMNP